jgi:Kef-type K+ transport system membrane component KefB
MVHLIVLIAKASPNRHIFVFPLSRKLGLGAVLGYLAAGRPIGPWSFKLIDDFDPIVQTAREASAELENPFESDREDR